MCAGLVSVARTDAFGNDNGAANAAPLAFLGRMSFRAIAESTIHYTEWTPIDTDRMVVLSSKRLIPAMTELSRNLTIHTQRTAPISDVFAHGGSSAATLLDL